MQNRSYGNIIQANMLLQELDMTLGILSENIASLKKQKQEIFSDIKRLKSFERKFQDIQKFAVNIDNDINLNLVEEFAKDSFNEIAQVEKSMENRKNSIPNFCKYELTSHSNATGSRMVRAFWLYPTKTGWLKLNFRLNAMTALQVCFSRFLLHWTENIVQTPMKQTRMYGSKVLSVFGVQNNLGTSKVRKYTEVELNGQVGGKFHEAISRDQLVRLQVPFTNSRNNSHSNRDSRESMHERLLTYKLNFYLKIHWVSQGNWSQKSILYMSIKLVSQTEHFWSTLILKNWKV